MTTRPPVGGRPGIRPAPATKQTLAFLAAVALGFPLLAILAQPAAAGPEILREAYAPATWDTSFWNVYANRDIAQSFLARTDFLVSHVDLYVFDQPNPGSDILQVLIAADAGNRPGPILASAAQQGLQNWTWVSFGFYPWVSLRAGQRYWIVTQDSQPRPKGYEWATNQPGGYAGGEAQWFDASLGRWVNNTGVDLFFKVFGISGPSLSLVLEPALLPVDPGALVPIDLYFNNSGNEAAKTARIDMHVDPGLIYQGDNAALEGGVQISPLSWTFNGVSIGPHHVTVRIAVDPNRSYYDGESLRARASLNYTDSAGQMQATVTGAATVTVLVPVIRAQATPNPAHVAPGATWNFTVSFFNVGSGKARYLWLNATPGSFLTAIGNNAASAGGQVLGPLSWLFQNVSAQVYVFNVTARASLATMPGDRLPLRLDFAYTNGAGQGLRFLSIDTAATIHGPSVVLEAGIDDPTPRPGNAVHASLYLNNTGDQNASWLWLNATLPTYTVLENSVPVAGTVSGNGVAYVRRGAAPGPFAITLTLRVSAAAPPAVRLALVASLEIENATGTKLRPSAALVASVVVTPRFVIVLSASTASLAPGDTLDLTLGWNNTGNDAASRVWLNFTLPQKTILRNASVPWSATNGTAFGWIFDRVGPGLKTFGVRLETGARLTDGGGLRATLNLTYERADGVLFAAGGSSIPFVALVPSPLPGLELLLLWIAVLVALFLLFLLLGYMDLLPHRRSSIDDVFLLHNSGILICHYSTTLRPDVDSDIASGMLMAVRNFVADAFRSKAGNLQELKYGDYRIQMTHGRYSILVVFTRGDPAKGLQPRMAEVLRNIEAAYEDVLESWSGQTEDFKGVEEHLLRLVAA